MTKPLETYKEGDRVWIAADGVVFVGEIAGRDAQTVHLTDSFVLVSKKPVAFSNNAEVLLEKITAWGSYNKRKISGSLIG